MSDQGEKSSGVPTIQACNTKIDAVICDLEDLIKRTRVLGDKFFGEELQAESDVSASPPISPGIVGYYAHLCSRLHYSLDSLHAEISRLEKL